MVKPTEFMYINPAMKNPRTGENVREQETAKLEALKADGKKVIGVELNVPADKEKNIAGLNEFCDIRIDPQHTDGKSDICCAKEVAENAERLLTDYRGKDVVVVCPRIDIDAIASMILISDYLEGKPLEYNKEALEEINTHDTHKKGHWEEPILTQSDIKLLQNKNRTPEDEKYLRGKLEKIYNPNDKMKALAASIKVFVDYSKEESVRGFNKSVENVRKFLSTGKIDEEIFKNYALVQNGIVDRILSGEINVEYKNGGTHIETKLPGMTDLVYAGAPAGTIFNPDTKKWTVCQYEAGYLQVVQGKNGKPTLKIAEALGEKESGWGGSTTICGSPMGTQSIISKEEMMKAFDANLTREYKAKVTSNVIFAEVYKNKRGRGE